MEEEKPILSIAAYIELLNEQLKFYDARIVGEVTQVKIWSSGHVYFTLKDKDTGAVLDCVIWKHLYLLFGIRIEEGMELIASGHANVYAKSGRLSFITNAIELVGEGALKKAYEQLKQKLTAEGIFAAEKKRPLPPFPQKIGIITSKQGAVIHDFLHNLGKHGFSLTMINTRVEGSEALSDLYRAIKTMKKKKLDVIVLMRGGGSLQSLAAFDAEVLVREVATSPVPIIAAIGHHQDIPLCGLAADVMVSTPTAAANLLSAGWEEGFHAVLHDEQKIIMSYKQTLSDVSLTIQLTKRDVFEKFNRIFSIFSHVSEQLPQYVSQVRRSLFSSSEEVTRHAQHTITHMSDALEATHQILLSVGKERLSRPFLFSLKQTTETLISSERLISVHNPLRQLALGYSIIRSKEGKLVKSIKDVTIKQTLTLTTADGTILSTVDAVQKGKTNE